jgi:hypothetical protein
LPPGAAASYAAAQAKLPGATVSVFQSKTDGSVMVECWYTDPNAKPDNPNPEIANVAIFSKGGAQRLASGNVVTDSSGFSHLKGL